jgi:hypothetical protein
MKRADELLEDRWRGPIAVIFVLVAVTSSVTAQSVRARLP